ncbi:MAG: hypothetical protein H6745_00975 [Deltaproteobacteria bacterium]|nr:hypothetical protein [Deltaproteobacteria bacterium]
MTTRRALLAASALALAACGAGDSPSPPADTGPGVRIAVAPLSLPGVTDAEYTLVVSNPGGEVWRKTLTSRGYGDGSGALSYVGPCDAAANPHTVTLTVDHLYGGTDGTTELTDWVDPGPIAKTPITCAAQGDTPVDFELTLLRAASQGFFDIAVDLEDLFCSAKVDCTYDDGAPIHLLHDPDGSGRGPTLVAALACTAGPNEVEATALHLSALKLSCDDGQGGQRVHWLLPFEGPGNLGPRAPEVFQHAVYRGVEALPNVSKCYWNTAIGLDPDALAGSCRLTGKATVSAGPFPDDRTPAGRVYPVIDIDVAVGAQGGELDCGQHPLGSAGVTVRYAEGERFDFEQVCGGDTVARGLRACGAVDGQGAEMIGLDAGVLVRVGDATSPVYPVPAGAVLDGCCLPE